MRMEPSRSNFCHPYEPYDIQLQFMQDLYQSIEDGKVAIFESPTGTGKSLSLICGSLTWLRDNARRELGEIPTKKQIGETDWLAAAEETARRRQSLQQREELEKKLAAIRRKEIAQQNTQAQERVPKRARTGPDNEPKQILDDEFMLNDYDSSDERAASNNGYGALSSSTLALLEKLRPVIREDETEIDEDTTKIIFCSRTHSQLTQFVNELKRVTPPAGLPEGLKEVQSNGGEEIVKHLPLGSRKNLCINDKVLRLSSTTAINERCLDLQKTGTAKENRCQFLPTKDDKVKMDTFRNRAIATIRDIEDLGNLGRKMELCSYYASRPAIAPSEILTLPYPLLLQKTAREALGVSVRGNIVVIDEAHNLMDAIADALSISLPLSHLDLATKQTVAYVQRFKNKLKGSNRMYVTHLIRLLNSFTDCIRSILTSGKTEIAVTASQLMAGKGVDQIRPHKLLHYLVQSKLAHKVEGYIDAHEEDVSASKRPKGILMHFQSFLAILMNPGSEGRFFVSKQDADAVVRYTLLDPREHFRDIVEQARAVILAGGTMSPMSDYVDYLFSYLDSSRISTFNFGHVISKENMLAMPIVKGPTGTGFDFTFEGRTSQAMISELGTMLVAVCRIVPDGVVVFFPSYDYLAQVTSVWKKSDIGVSIMSSLQASKTVFEESRGLSTENLLRDYARAIDAGHGGLMLSVVGGKLSEGINFSDKLGRAVIAVGLPFPNMNSAEWRSKIEHIEESTYKRYKEIDGLSAEQLRSRARLAGKDFYENACMRAVNQSIGRAIRHKDDYAIILLVDKRFATERISKKLPGWIQSSMKGQASVNSWTSIERDIKNFFANRNA